MGIGFQPNDRYKLTDGIGVKDGNFCTTGAVDFSILAGASGILVSETNTSRTLRFAPEQTGLSEIVTVNGIPKSLTVHVSGISGSSRL